MNRLAAEKLRERTRVREQLEHRPTAGTGHADLAVLVGNLAIRRQDAIEARLRAAVHAA